MRNSIRRILLAILSWNAIVALFIGLMYIIAQRKSLGSEGWRYAWWAFLIGLVVVLSSSPICSRLRRVPSVLIGITFGLFLPPLLGWIWGTLEPWSLSSILQWTGLDAWIAGLQLAIPSGLAGALVGYVQARKSIPIGGPPTR